MEHTSYLDRLSHWARNSVSLKLFTIGFLILILLIPSSMISSLINERESTRDEVVREVSSKWAGRQEISGPVVSVPYYQYGKDKDGNVVTNINYAHFLPDYIKVRGQLMPEKRYRGIYVVVLYNAKLKIEGHFGKLNSSALPIESKNYILKDARLTMGITDMKGIRKNITVKLNDKPSTFEPGMSSHDIFESGISMPIQLDTSGIQFSMDLDINGSSSIFFLPLGKETDVTLNSSWSNPSFDGAFLPEKKNITNDGFTATWHILELNRNFPQQGTGRFIDVNNTDENDSHADAASQAAFGVKLILPVDEYQKTMRSAKYCIMFIVLTFLAFFFVEVFTRKRLHPVQYLLVGFAVVLFYILLLSISEHMSFNSAYLLSSLAILAVVTTYTRAIFKNWLIAALLFTLLSILYGFFYSLLQLEDYALLMGSIGLLLILSIIMYMTRNIDWYAVGKLKEEE